MESKPKNREWVKNAAIIFLAVLLVLTFFSNTIMNRSLPEVVTAYVSMNTINAKVRGTGTVESLGVYEVKAPETREIRAVMVRTGQKIEAGDVLFVLGEGDSAEIEEASEHLRQLKLQYSQTALSAPNYAGQLNKAQQRYNAAVAAEAEAYAELSGNADLQDAITALDSSKDRLSKAELAYALANDTALQSLSAASTAFESFASACGAAGIDTLSLNDARYALSGAAQALTPADGSLNSVTVAFEKLCTAESGIKQYELTNSSDIIADPAASAALSALYTCLTQAKSYISDEYKSDDLTDAVNELITAIEKNNSAQTQYEGFNGLFTEKYNAAVAERQAAEAALKALQDAADENGRSAALTGLSLQDLSYQIEKAQEKLDSLTGGSENQITANVSGTVTEISVTAGSTAQKDAVIATIEVPDMGYTLSFSVTTDQAKRLHQGDSASITSYYWGSRIDATLSEIKPDPKNPQGSKLLVFDVTGDVTAGSQLTLSIGERGASYDCVVPNSAIRSDSNGKYVLVLQEKTSPLGNRYFARRVDIEVIAADDSNSAVTGALDNGVFVITTSSAPIKSGDQVRMSEG